MAERLALAASWRQRLFQWARWAAPREACGLLLGRPGGDDRSGQVVRALLARNLDRRLDRFDLHPEDQLLAERVARASALEVLGVWHAHPGNGPEPSRRDRAGALPGWWYLVLGLAPAERLGCYRARRPGELVPAELVLPEHVSLEFVTRGPSGPESPASGVGPAPG